jgi:nucleotide-binding universal stress UspA family protein
MAHEQQPCVLVGFDGTRRQDAVLEVAAGEALRRRLPLTIAGAVVVKEGREGHERSPDGRLRTQDRAAADADERLVAAAARVRRDHPALPVSRVLLREDAPAGSVPPAQLLVLGANRAQHTTFGLGTAGWSLVRAVACPVVVVPSPALAAFGQGYTAGPVVAGVGQDPLDVEVLREAVAAARARGTAVQLVHAVRPRPTEPGRAAHARACARAAELIRRARVGLDVPVRTVLSSEEPAAALRRCAARASLLVIGSHRPLALAGPGVGSVGRGVIGDVPCPVQVVVHRTVPGVAGARSATAGAGA